MNGRKLSVKRLLNVHLPIALIVSFLLYVGIASFNRYDSYQSHGQCTIGKIEDVGIDRYGRSYAKFTFLVDGLKFHGQNSGEISSKEKGRFFAVVYLPGELKTARMLFDHPLSEEQSETIDCAEILGDISIFDM